MRYYTTPRWKFKSKLLKNLHPYCAKCGSTVQLQVHHQTYERYGEEVYEDLEVLCRKCHEKEHGRKM